MAWLGFSARKETVRIERGGWLDALRFVMAFLIILHHYQLAAPIPLATLHPVFERGYLLTDFFLIDSGYVLGRVYGERVLSGRMTPADFFRKRGLRVVPAHLLMSLALIILVGGSALAGIAPRHPEWFDWSQLPAQVFLVQSYGVPGGLGWNAPSWSISALLGCYLCFPTLLQVIGRLRPLAALGLGLGVFLLADLLTWTLLGYPVYQMPMKYGLLRALPLFLGGMALARFAQQVFVPAAFARVMGVCALLTLAGLQAFGRFSLVSLALICLLILAAGAIPVRRKSRLIERAALVSFSMFITNEVVRIGYFGVVNAVEARVATPRVVEWALWAGGVASALTFAVVFHYVVDLPTQRLAKRWASPDSRRSAKTGDIAAAEPDPDSAEVPAI